MSNYKYNIVMDAGTGEPVVRGERILIQDTNKRVLIQDTNKRILIQDSSKSDDGLWRVYKKKKDSQYDEIHSATGSSIDSKEVVFDTPDLSSPSDAVTSERQLDERLQEGQSETDLEQQSEEPSKVPIEITTIATPKNTRKMKRKAGSQKNSIMQQCKKKLQQNDLKSANNTPIHIHTASSQRGPANFIKKVSSAIRDETGESTLAEDSFIPPGGVDKLGSGATTKEKNCKSKDNVPKVQKKKVEHLERAALALEEIANAFEMFVQNM